MKSRMSEQRSPLKQKPLRNPGQSLDERIHDLFIDRLLPPAVVAVFAVLLAGLEWWRRLSSSPPQPWILTIVAAASVVFATRTFYAIRGELRSLTLGRDGEKSVAQELEGRRKEGWQLLHDVPGSGFNVDHVLVTPHGIFAIETKTRRKPLDHDARVQFDGERVLVDGRESDRNPLTQARASRDWIRALLEEMTGIRFPVKAVVLFPGWFVETTGASGTSDVWVLNPKALTAFIEKETQVIKSEDVALAGSRLSIHMSSLASST